MKTEKFINPHFYDESKKKINKEFINTRSEDIATYGKTGEELKPKDYSEATKTFDATWRQTGLRG